VCALSATAASQLDAECDTARRASSSAFAWVIEDAVEIYGAKLPTGQRGVDALHLLVRLIIASEYPISDAAVIGPEAYLHRLMQELRQLAGARHHLEVSCRERDASRGVRIIPDYMYVHGLSPPRDREGPLDGEKGAKERTLSYRDTDAVLAESARRYQAILASIEALDAIIGSKV
jgi:hypothetical protein